MSGPTCSDCGMDPAWCRCPAPPHQSPLEGMEATIAAAEALGTFRFQKFIGPAELMKLAVDDVIESAEPITKDAAP